MQLNFYGGPISDGLDYYGIYPTDSTKSNLKDKELRKQNWSESFTYERRPEEGEEFSQPHYELLTTWNLEPSVKFYNSLFYVQGAGQFDFDGTWVYPFTGFTSSYYYALTPEYGKKYGFTGITDTTLGNELTRGYVGSKQFGWLPRIEWQHEDGTLNIGAEVRIHRSLHWGKLLSASKMPTDLPGDYHFYEYKGGKDIFSFYASELYKATDKLNFSLSAQLLHQTYRFYDQKPFYIDPTFAASNGLIPGFTNYQFTIPLTFLNPRFGVNYLLSDNLNIYGSLSYTSREARLKDYYNAEFFSEPNFAKTQFGTYDFGSPNVKPESLMDIEIGSNLTEAISPEVLWKENAVFYYMPFKDELTSTGAVDRFGSSIVGNAEKVLHFGLELTERFEFQNTLVLEGNITWSHNEIKEFSSYKNPDAVVGKVPIGFPSLLAGLSADYHLSKAITIGLTGRYVGTMYGDIENTDLYKNDPYFVMDGNLLIRQENVAGLSFVELKIQANNILNEYYTSYVESGSGYFVAAPFNIFGGIQIGL
jgi:iron complex outermembrane receptor protein